MMPTYWCIVAVYGILTHGDADTHLCISILVIRYLFIYGDYGTVVHCFRWWCSFVGDEHSMPRWCIVLCWYSWCCSACHLEYSTNRVCCWNAITTLLFYSTMQWAFNSLFVLVYRWQTTVLAFIHIVRWFAVTILQCCWAVQWALTLLEVMGGLLFHSW